MGASDITDKDLVDLGVVIEEKKDDGDRTLKIPNEFLPLYMELIKSKMTKGFWNEIVGEKEIIFVFKFTNGVIKEFKLSPENEQEIDNLCAVFNNESAHEQANVYKYISNNKFYHDFMTKHYSDMINRK